MLKNANALRYRQYTLLEENHQILWNTNRIQSLRDGIIMRFLFINQGIRRDLLGQVEDRALAGMEQGDPSEVWIARLQSTLEKRVKEFRLIPVKRSSGCP